jgi:SAM-dependent methyltransferase
VFQEAIMPDLNPAADELATARQMAAGAEHGTAIDTTVAHPARRYNYWLGGKDNFAADRISGDAIAVQFPGVRAAAMENRRFLRRAVQFLAWQGIRQFLDIGTGLPAPDNTHEVAQAIAPHSRVLYVDNDPMVLAHARALLTSPVPDSTAYLDADLRNPGSILQHLQLHNTLDLQQPVGLLLVAVLHFIPNTDRPHDLAAELLRALVPGSYLVLSHATADHLTADDRRRLPALTTGDHAGFHPRSRADIAAFADGLDLVEPGLVSVAAWRAEHEPEPRPTAADVGVYGVVARIPDNQPAPAAGSTAHRAAAASDVEAPDRRQP